MRCPIHCTFHTKNNARWASSGALERSVDPAWLHSRRSSAVAGLTRHSVPPLRTTCLATIQGLGGFLTSSEEPVSTRNRPALWMAPSASLEISWGQESTQLGGRVTMCSISCLYPSYKRATSDSSRRPCLEAKGLFQAD